MAIRCLESLDFIVAPQRLQDLIEALKKTGAAARIDLKTVFGSRRRCDRLRLQIDADPPRPLREFDLGGKPVDNLLVDDDGQDAVLKAVGEENIAEARTDDGADARFLQRPYRAFAGRAAAEIRPGDEDLRLPVGLAVQDKGRIFRAIRQIAQ